MDLRVCVLKCPCVGICCRGAAEIQTENGKDVAYSACVCVRFSFLPSDTEKEFNATGEKRGEKSNRHEEREWEEGQRWYRWKRKSTSSHTETINKLSSQSISYGLAWVIALCQSRLCVAWESVRGDVMVKYKASAAVGLTLIVTFVIKRAEESQGEVSRRHSHDVRGV